MPTIREVTRALQSQLGRKQDRLAVYPALMGNGSGTVAVSSRPGYVYVRIGNDQILAQAFNQRVPNRDDMPVIVGYDATEPELFQVLTIRQIEYIRAGYEVISQIPPHHITHEWPVIGDSDSDGSDVVYAGWRQITDLRLSVVSGYSVKCGQGPIYRDGTGWTWITTQTLDLTSSKPSTGARYVLVYLDTDGTLASRDGTLKLKSEIAFSDVPAAVAGEFPLGAVLLYSGQTSLQDDRDEQNVIDLRWPQTYSASSTFLGLTDTPSSFSGQAGKGVEVNGDETDLAFTEFADLVHTHSYWEPLTDGAAIGTELVFTADGDVIMVEVDE